MMVYSSFPFSVFLQLVTELLFSSNKEKESQFCPFMENQVLWLVKCEIKISFIYCLFISFCNKLYYYNAAIIEFPFIINILLYYAATTYSC